MEVTEISQIVTVFKISESFICEWSEDDRFFVITDDGLDIFHFKPNPKNVAPEFAFDKSFICPLVYYPTEHAGFDMEMVSTLSKDAASALFYNPILLPQWNITTPMPICFLKASWSPTGLAGSKNCMLTLLTNSGSVTLWEYQYPHWIIKVDISNHIINYLKASNRLGEIDKDSSYFDEFLKRCKQLISTSAAWSPAYHQDGVFTSFIATAQRSGDVYIHRITSAVTPHSNQTAKLEETLQSTLDNIVSAHWIKLNVDSLVLILGDTNGLCEYFEFKINHDLQLNFIRKQMLWKDKDKLKITKITTGRLNDETDYVLITKHSYLIIIFIEVNLEVKQTVIKNLGNLQITSINKLSETKFIVSSFSGELNLCEIVTNSDGFAVKCERIATKLEVSWNNLYGMCLSRNAAICVICLTPSINTDRMFGKSTSTIVIYGLHQIDLLDTIMKNETGVLTKHWDLMDLLRITILKKTAVPKVVDEITADMPIYLEKINLWTRVMLMSVSAEYSPQIKKQWFLRILISHVKLYVDKLISKYEQARILDNFDNTTLSLQVRFLKHHNKKSDLNFGIDSLLQRVTRQTKLVLSDVVNYCDWCEEAVESVECSQGHPRQYCCVTLQDVSDDDYLICPLCQSNGHSRLSIEEQICTFCDSQFVRTYHKSEDNNSKISFPEYKFASFI